MAYEFHVREGRWSSRRLRAFVDSWLTRPPVRVLERMRWTRGAVGNGAWVLPEGGVRGCSVDLVATSGEVQSVRVRLNLMASRMDWQLAQALVRDLHRAGGGVVTTAQGEAVRPEALREPEAAGEAFARLREDGREIAQQLGAGNAFAALPNPLFSLLVTAALLPDEPEAGRMALALEDELVDMAARYQRAQVVAPTAMPDGNSLSTWSGRDALLALTHFTAYDPGASQDPGVVLPTPEFLQALGGRVELVSERRDRFYLPTLDPENTADAAILQAVRKRGTPLEAWLARFPA